MSEPMTNDTFAELRGRIDAIDGEIGALLLKRVQLSNVIMSAKAPGELVDPQREREIADRYAARLAPLSTAPRIQRLVVAILGISELYPDR